jgi:hypothetical protein
MKGENELKHCLGVRVSALMPKCMKSTIYLFCSVQFAWHILAQVEVHAQTQLYNRHTHTHT